MRILLDQTELELLLERRRDYIGRAKDGLLDSVFAAGTFLFSWLYTECDDFFFIPGMVVKSAFLLFALVFLGRGVFLMIGRRNYSVEQLKREINDLNRITHPFSIVGIRDTYNKYANRFLLYYDSRWDCYLFPNGRTDSDAKVNEQNLKNDISRSLKIAPDLFCIEKRGERIHQKYSVSDQVQKWYHHTFYEMKVEQFPDEMKNIAFDIEGTSFRWMSLAEMEKNPRIQEVNSDIVAMAKELYH